jgi:hypothetical protein
MSQQPKALNDNLLIYNPPLTENTAKVIAPGTISPMGKIVFNLGDPRADAGLVSRDLLDTAGDFAVNATATKVAYPLDPATQLISTDNQIIRLQDGSLLVSRNGYTWSDLSPRPEWFDTISFTFYNGVVTGRGRSAVYVFRSTDAGQNWELWSMIDSAVAADGKYGWPAQYKKKEGSLAVTIGGFDRTELYQDPWSGDIFISGSGGGGPYPTLADPQVKNHAGVIFRSQDNGKTWETYHEFTEPGSSSPYVMTSTAHHRLIVFNVVNWKPTLHYVEKGIMSEGKTIIASDNGTLLTCGIPPVASEVGDVDLFRSQPCIARMGRSGDFDSVWVAYPSINASKMQTYVVALVTFGGTSTPQVKLVANVTAEEPKTASALLGAFVYDDLVDPDDQNTDPSCTLFYWVDTPRSSSADKNKLIARYQVFHSGQSFPPGYLSVSNGAKRYFARTVIAHYFSGGYFWLNNELNFLAQWKETDGIKANIISLPPFPQVKIYREFIELIILPHPDPALREKINVVLRGMSIAQRSGLVRRLNLIQSYVNESLQELDDVLLTDDIGRMSALSDVGKLVRQLTSPR